MAKQGMNLTQLANELQRRSALKRDFITPTSHLKLVPGPNGMDLKVGDQAFSMAERTHGQIAARLNIPKKHYNRLDERHPDILAYEVNELFKRENETRMVRTLDGKARAFLSDKYKVMDNEVVFEAVGLALGELNTEYSIDTSRGASMSVTDEKLYLKFVLPALQAEVKVGEVVSFGFSVSTGEVGNAKLEVAPWLLTWACLNGMKLQQALGKYHLGGKAEQRGEIEYRNDTVKAQMEALKLEIRDTIAQIGQRDYFEAHIARLKASTEGTVHTNHPVNNIVEVTAKKYAFGEDEKNFFTQHLYRKADYSPWGISSAVTRMSQDVTSYDRASDLESVGNQIIDLPRSWWTTELDRVAAAATQ